MTTYLDLPQRRILAVSALMHELNGENYEMVGGAERPNGTGSAVWNLARWWSVRTTRELLDTLTSLAEQGHRAEWADEEGVSRTSFFAWDFARLSHVAGLGYRTYLLDLETTWYWLKRAALALQPAFGSFAELGEGYVEALACWCGGAASEQVRRAQSALAALLSREGSAYRLPWDLDLAGAVPPRIDIPEASVELGESIAAAIERVGRGGRVLIAPGTYRESLRPPHSVEIVAAGDGEVLVEGDERPALWIDRMVSAYVRGLSLKTGRTRTDEPLNAVHVAGGSIWLERCDMSGTHNGCFGGKDTHVRVISSRIHDCGRHGIETVQGDFAVVDSEIRGVAMHGVACFSEALPSVLAGVRVLDAAKIGVAVTGTIVVRDTLIEGAGEFGVVGEGGANITLVGSKVRSSKGWGCLVQDGTRAEVVGTTIEGSAKTNVEVAKGHLVLRGCTVADAQAYGVTLQPDARALIVDSTISGNAQGNVMVMSMAQAVLVGCTLRGGTFGLWSRSAALRCAESTVEETEGPSVQIVEMDGGVFSDCTVRHSKSWGIGLGAGASARFSRCTIELCAAGSVFADPESTPVLEDCEVVHDPAQPVDLAPNVLHGAVDGPDEIAAELEDVKEEAGAFLFHLGAHPAIASAFAKRSAVPDAETIGPAVIGACRRGELGVDEIEFYLDDGFFARAPDRALLAKVRDVAQGLLRHPRELRAEVDRVELARAIAHLHEEPDAAPPSGPADA
jgi:hypothetical protein